MSNELDRRFGAALKRLRESRGKSQEDFVRTGRSYLSELERGLKTPTLETIVILAEEFGVTPTYLVAKATEPQSEGGEGEGRRGDLADVMTRAYHLAVNAEREVVGPPVFSANNSLREVSEIASGSKVELERLLADAALLAFREANDRPAPARRNALEFVVADKRPQADLEFAVDGTDHWWLRPQVALEALKSANRTIELLDELSRMNEIPIFRLLGMRNLSSFIGAIYVHSVWQLMSEKFKINPHQDGYPDLCALTTAGRQYIERVEGMQRDTAKESFTHYQFGGIEVKATCGNTPPPAEGQPKPQIGESRTHLVTSADWKAHHRSTNNLLGLYWDFIDGLPTIVGLFYSNKLVEDDWGKIVMPKVLVEPAPGEE
jgi:transcriptional regulator with XRE-family HTH domain